MDMLCLPDLQKIKYTIYNSVIVWVVILKPLYLFLAHLRNDNNLDSNPTLSLLIPSIDIREAFTSSH